MPRIFYIMAVLTICVAQGKPPPLTDNFNNQPALTEKGAARPQNPETYPDKRLDIEFVDAHSDGL